MNLSVSLIELAKFVDDLFRIALVQRRQHWVARNSLLFS